MTFAASMRIGTLEITTALAAAALIAARPRARRSAEIAALQPVSVVLRVVELGRARLVERLCPLTIGRDRACDLVLADPEVSRRHARLETEGGVVYLRDLESRNGTFLNARALEGVVETREGDVIDVGATRLIVEKLKAVPWT
ncbi:MAG TPA: FHA domain-containing protein [Candidatus Acidoferrales bacterium]|nr:FHA domain-containing protein [Candidatus Acidoferrales bacterium]